MQYGTIDNVERYSTVGGGRDGQQEEQDLKTSNSFKMMGARKGSLASLSPMGLGQKDRSPMHMND